MWYMLAVSVHVVLSLLLILIIILQPGKGGDVGAAFGGGGSGNMFGPRGPTNLLQQGTTVVAVGFMCTSIILAIFSNQALLAGGGDVLEDIERLQRDLEEEANAPADDVVPAEEAPAEEAMPTDDAAPTDAVPAEPGEAMPADDAAPADEAGAEE